MGDPVANVSDDEFAVERDVVVSEYRQRFETDPDGAQLQWLLEETFRRHPYARPVGGTPESLRAVTLADARAWAKVRYVPANAVVVIVSPQPAREVVRQVFGAFGALASAQSGPPRAEAVPAFAPAPAADAEDALFVTKSAPVSRPVLWVAWPVPGEAGRRTPLGHAAANAMNAAMWPLLFRTFAATGSRWWATPAWGS